MREMRLAAWVRTSLLGILLGLGLAKYAQARVGDALHTAALVGTVVVAASAALTAVAAHRYLVWGTCSPRRYPAARPLVSLSLFVVVVLAWLALALIWAAGPDALPAQAP